MTKTKLDAKSPVAAAVLTPLSPTWERTLRETIESIAIAFILAFLFRTFEAEAFVIPTGSMAPTLQGRHKDVVCPQCGYEYRVSASSEVDRDGARMPNCNVIGTTCPMCDYEVKLDRGDLDDKYPSFSGDRIIVNKFAYDLSDPQRWDVVVFKYPEDSKTNYIKRLVGLPNERFQIRSGDIYTAPPGTEQFQIARKSPEKLRATLQPVYDNDFVLPKLITAGVQPRWQPWTAATDKSAWSIASDLKSFEIDGQSPTRSWLRYQNIVPTEEVWRRIGQNQHVASPEPSLIVDDYAYNDGNDDSCGIPRGYPHPVGDIAVDCQLVVKNDKGAVILELVKGGRQFRCQIDLATGQAKLSISGVADFAPTATTPIHGAGSYDVSFSNVDRQLLLWVNGGVVQFNVPTTYDELGNATPVEKLPQPGQDVATDLSPVGIAAEGGASIAVNHLKVWRDIYYRAQAGDHLPPNFLIEDDLSRVIELGPNEFFMMGDNSPASADSRYWGKVDRRLLIGKALFIYWPHSWWPSWAVNIPKVDIKVPFWPNLKRMTFVH